MKTELDFYHVRDEHKIWWVDDDEYGIGLFSFDKKKIYSLAEDYPDKLTEYEKELFDKENPQLALVYGKK